MTGSIDKAIDMPYDPPPPRSAMSIPGASKPLSLQLAACCRPPSPMGSANGAKSAAQKPIFTYALLSRRFGTIGIVN